MSMWLGTVTCYYAERSLSERKIAEQIFSFLKSIMEQKTPMPLCRFHSDLNYIQAQIPTEDALFEQVEWIQAEHLLLKKGNCLCFKDTKCAYIAWNIVHSMNIQ